MKILPSEITNKEVYEKRREFLKMMAASGLILPSLPSIAQTADYIPGKNPRLMAVKGGYMIPDDVTTYKDITTYNNFYEFGIEKDAPSKAAKTLKLRPWTIRVEGLVNRPQTFDIETLLSMSSLEERIYRLRCVEGWSMVVPWIGYSLINLIKKVEPLSNAKFVEFISLADSQQMPHLNNAGIPLPYTEALRIDEAVHPLTLLTFGLYGEVLPQQNGAPVRITVPWKYGFKSPKSIVAIRFLDKMPMTTRMKMNLNEYSFYANVNPSVDHPRWSQATEQRIGEKGVFVARRKTLMFNGYNEVASLYTGLDLKRNF